MREDENIWSIVLDDDFNNSENLKSVVSVFDSYLVILLIFNYYAGLRG